MPAAPTEPSVTDRTPVMLVCVYYRVAAGDSQRVISAVREFQRTLPDSGHADEGEVLLRCDLPPPAATATSPDARPASSPTHAPPVDPADAGADAAVDATVMETYRLRLPLAGTDADAAVRDFLALLETASSPFASLLRGARHVELFSPCAS
jgi:hypothetical protein